MTRRVQVKLPRQRITHRTDETGDLRFHLFSISQVSLYHLDDPAADYHPICPGGGDLYHLVCLNVPRGLKFSPDSTINARIQHGRGIYINVDGDRTTQVFLRTNAYPQILPTWECCAGSPQCEL